MKTLTKGHPLKLIVLFAIPLALGQLFQLFYSIVDTRIVGVTLGEAALASVGSTSTLSDLMISLLNGATNGFSIIIATCFGARDEKKLKQSVAATFLLGIALALILTLFCSIFLPGLLAVLHVSPELYDNARSYIRVILLGLLATALYNICAAVLRAIGDTITPLIFLVLSSFLNIFLDYAFILGLGLGVAGAAIATVLSQVISFLLCFGYMWKKYPLLRLCRSDFNIPAAHIVRMLKSGMSMGLMYSLVNFGTVALQTTINTFGTETIVAHTAARKITSVYMLPFGVFSQAVATYCGQNLGAGEYKRIRAGLIQTIGFVLCWDLLVLFLTFTVVSFFIKGVTGSDNPVIIATATKYLRFDTTFYFVTTFVCLIRNALQGIGDTVTPIISSFFELLSKVLVALLLAPAIGYWGIIIAEPLSWFIMVIPLMIQFFKNPILNGKASQTE